MDNLIAAAPISPLRQRLIDDMNMRRFSHETQRSYIRDVGRLAALMGRRPDQATAEDLRRFQVEQREAGVPVPTMNSIVSALRFFFTQTLDRPDLARRLVRLSRGDQGENARQSGALPHFWCSRPPCMSQTAVIMQPTSWLSEDHSRHDRTSASSGPSAG